VRFLGYIPFGDIKRYYSIIDIMAFPRTAAKVCRVIPPLKPLEAMAMGKPVIVSDVEALREMVRNERTGLVCRAEDAHSLAEQILRLAGNGELRAELTENACRWVCRERDWSVVGQRILAVYEELLQ
jgi:glycosyltransferase involved in cell wall biosynthesis